MVTPNQAEHLFTPLLVRAHAIRVWPQLNFVDQAAEYLVQTLDLDQQPWGAYKIESQHQLELQRCKWIDHCVLNFLEQYPNAIGIELGSGLSTRFQRLSAKIDWPRFSWVDVDSRDVIDCADLIFPRTDNYKMVPCEILKDDWLKKSGWLPGRPLVVVMETLPENFQLSDLKLLLERLVNATEMRDEAGNRSPVHFVMDYESPIFHFVRQYFLGRLFLGNYCHGILSGQDFLNKLKIKGRVLGEKDLVMDSQNPLRYRLLAKIYRGLTHKHFWGAVHLEIGHFSSD